MSEHERGDDARSINLPRWCQSISGTSERSERLSWQRCSHLVQFIEGRKPVEEEGLTKGYRKNASYCRVKAARTRDAQDKAKWLEYADAWEQLADKIAREGSPPEAMAIDPSFRARDKTVVNGH
jgi:hypothetical protein